MRVERRWPRQDSEWMDKMLACLASGMNVTIKAIDMPDKTFVRQYWAWNPNED